MDIEKLKKKRQLNVQEQNALLKHSIQQEAFYWRQKGIPEGLKKHLSDKGINFNECILLDYEQDFPGCSTDFGMVLTNKKQFFEFDLDLSSDRQKILKLYEWKDVTDKVEVNGHKPGTGASWGYLAIEILDELNQS